MQQQHKKLRLFIAIESNEDIQRSAGQLKKRLGSKYQKYIRWMVGKQIHLTLRFLGSVDHNQLESLKSTIQSATKTIKPFVLPLENIILFPEHRPKVIAIQCKLTDSLAQLYQSLEQAIQTLGFQAETRPFNPHITIARLNHPPKNIDVSSIAMPKTLLVNQIVLYHSDTQPTGIVYTPISIFKL